MEMMSNIKLIAKRTRDLKEAKLREQYLYNIIERRKLDLIDTQNKIVKLHEYLNYVERFTDQYGYKALELTGGRITSMNDYSESFQSESDRHKMFTKPVRNAILEKFTPTKIYESEDLFNGFAEIFSRFGITTIKPHIKTVRRYFGASPLKGKNTNGKIRLGRFVPDHKYDE
jgi:hypothetical protein